MNPAFPLNLSVRLDLHGSLYRRTQLDETELQFFVMLVISLKNQKPSPAVVLSRSDGFRTIHPDTLSPPPRTLSFVIIHLTSRGHLPINCNYYITFYAAAHLQHRSVHCSSTCLWCLSWSPEDETFGLKDVLPVGGADWHIFTLVSTVWRFPCLSSSRSVWHRSRPADRPLPSPHWASPLALDCQPGALTPSSTLLKCPCAKRWTPNSYRRH